jgi:uncharacterized Zn finger protein
MLDKLISRLTLDELAGAAAFGRGEDYFSTGAVERLRISDDKITARVEGTDSYQVELWNDDGELAYDCTCPRAADGYFCKHCVAVGLAWLAEKSTAVKSGKASGKKKRHDPWRDIKTYLLTQPSEALIDILLDTAQRDDRLYQSLLLKAERAGGDKNAIQAFRRAIDSVTCVSDTLDWREAVSFSGDIDRVVDSLSELLKPDTADMLVELAEYAIERVEHSMEQVDDSDGDIGNVVERLGALHLKACMLAKPEPAGLAERLFRFETTLPMGICSFDTTTYRDALGLVGQHRYRELAETEWRKFKPRDAKDSYDAHRSRITRIMEQLARDSGDVEDLVAIKSRDLSSDYHYLGIAEICAKAGQSDKALEWAERGLKAFPERPDNRLRDFLVAVYLKLKRNDEALQLTWVQFEEQVTLEYYKKLHDVADKLGIWSGQRERALQTVADVIAREANATSKWRPKPSTPDYSLRVEIALWENDLNTAWEFAHKGIRNRSLLIELAGKLASSRPDDAVSLYRRAIPHIVEQTSNTAYEQAIKLIRKVGELMNVQNQPRQFGDYLAELHVQFKPKRNFIKLLDGVVRSVAK